MKKSTVKWIGTILCAALAVNSIGATAYALSSDKSNAVKKENAAALSTEEKQETVKDETVYVLAGADGTVKKIIVSDWIKNALGESQIKDMSNLTGIENVKGDETYTMNADNMQVWDAQGNDIYYQGSAEKELPVNMSVSYTLNNQPIAASELAGKSGHVTVRFQYVNQQYETVLIDGKSEKIYVPFAMLTGMLLDNDIFSNVAVSNGKIINDGDKTAVIGIAFPGLSESLAIDKEKADIPDYVEINADVKNFAMTSTMTVATNELFNKINTKKLDSIDELTASLDEMAKAASQLVDGSSKLYAGMNTLMAKSDELIEGIHQLAEGASRLKEGAGQLDAGAGQLVLGSADLYAGLTTITVNNNALNGGAKQVFETLLAGADAQIAAAGLPAPELTIENYAAALDQMIAMLNSMGAAEGAQSLTALKNSLDSYNEFYTGLKAYTTGVSQAAAGAEALKAGADGLKAGTSELYSSMDVLCNGIFTLQDSMPALKGGISELEAGTMTLSEGMKEFQQKGVQKLTDYVEGDVKKLVTRFQAVIDVSKDYYSFSGISDEMKGEVKFIYRTDSVKTE